MNLGIQWQRETDAVLEYNRLVLPTVLKSINCRSREFWQQLKDDNPTSIRIYRHYPNFDCWQDNPEQCAIDAVHAIMAEIAHIQDLITYIEDNNEWIHSFMYDQVDAADRYMEAFIKTAWNSFGMRTVFLNSACGHWGDDIAVFHRTLKVAEQYGAILGQHEYDYPTMMRIHEETGDYWLCGKWKKSMAAIKSAGYKNIKCIITEAGIDGGVADLPMKGWRSVSNSLENYCASLLWYNDLLINDEDVLGTAIFIMSGHGEWGSFDIEGSEVPARIAQFPTVPPPEPPEEPEPPNGNGGEQMIRVFDMDDIERDEQWAKDKYGVAWRRYPATVGQKVYRLVELREKTGYTSLVTKAIDENGNPIKELPITFFWSDAPWPPDPPTEVFAHDWYDRFTWGKTNENGDVGPGMGTGAYHGWGEGGPHAVWVHHPTIPSDICEKLGMMAGTFHDHLDQVFQLTTVEEEPEEPVDGELLEVAQKIYDEVKETRLLTAEIRDFLKGWEPPEPPEPPDPEPPKGYFGQYFNNRNLEGAPVVERWDDAIFFDWGTGPPATGINADNFSVRWTASREFEVGTWRFHVRVDDGVRLFVDGQLLIEDWKDFSPREFAADKALSAGEHSIKMEYYEHGGGAVAEFWYHKL